MSKTDPRPESPSSQVSTESSEELDSRKRAQSITEMLRLDSGRLEPIESMLRDKVPAKEEDFGDSRDKISGVSTGFVADRLVDGKTHMLKVVADSSEKISTRANDNRGDLIREFISGRIYSRVLYDAAPRINLALSTDRKSILLTSKFLEGFKSLTELTEKKDNGDINPDHQDLKNIIGFEKVIAACVFGGEIDYHASNIGVVPVVNDDGKEILNADGQKMWSAVKIDHGKSTLTFDSEKHIRNNLCERMKYFSYQNISFSLTAFKESLDQMTKLSDEEIGKFVERDISELTKAGMKFDSIGTISSDKVLKSEEEAKEYFVSNFKNRRDITKKLVETLEIIEKIEPVPEKWKDGQWLYDIAGRDPIAWAVENGKQIVVRRDKDGRAIETEHPVDWAIKNSKLIEGIEPSEWRAERERRMASSYPQGRKLQTPPAASPGLRARREEARLARERADPSAVVAGNIRHQLGSESKHSSPPLVRAGSKVFEGRSRQ